MSQEPSGLRSDDDIVTAREGAADLGVTRATVFRWSRRRLVEPVAASPQRFRMGDLRDVHRRQSLTVGALLRLARSDRGLSLDTPESST